MCKTLNLTKEEQWRRIPWNKFDKQVRKIQKRIYDASFRNDFKTVRTLQKVLIGLTSAKFIAIKQISQDNREGNTTGMDGIVYLTIAQCIDLVEELEIDGKSDAIRRVYSCRPNSRQRFFGIPTMKDRAKQFLLLMALEPEWEARFEPNNYGFRPGLSCQDARVAICQSLEQKAKYVFNASIEPCFPAISHKPLLDRLNTIPRFRRQIRAWLTAGITFEEITEPNLTETFQAAPISPLLTNIALHGLEKYVTKQLGTWSKRGKLPKEVVMSNGITVRYANNFVILYPYFEVLEKVVIEIDRFLVPLGLNISKHNSSIKHTLLNQNGQNAGFSFLGFYFLHKKCGIGKTSWVANKVECNPLGYYLSQTPDKENVKRHIESIRDIVKNMEKSPQEKLIAKLNLIIHGWTQYYAYTDNKATFKYCDERMFGRLLRYAYNRHKQKGKKWVIKKYFHTFQDRKWIFSTPDHKNRIDLYFKGVNQNRYVKVIKGVSPYYDKIGY